MEPAFLGVEWEFCGSTGKKAERSPARIRRNSNGSKAGEWENKESGFGKAGRKQDKNW
jgi:hypothetical protein